jgi:hypothetical protein
MGKRSKPGGKGCGSLRACSQKFPAPELRSSRHQALCPEALKIARRIL